MQEIPIVLIGQKDHGKSTLIGRLLPNFKKLIEEGKLKSIFNIKRNNCAKNYL